MSRRAVFVIWGVLMLLFALALVLWQSASPEMGPRSAPTQGRSSRLSTDSPDGGLASTHASGGPTLTIPEEAPAENSGEDPWPPPGTIFGTVRTVDGDPVAESEVEARSFPEARFGYQPSGALGPIEFSTRSDADGRYSVQVPPGIEHAVAASSPGLASAVGQARAGDRLDFVLALAPVLRFEVMAQACEAIEGARVRIRERDQALVEVAAVTDASGKASINGLPDALVLEFTVDHDEYCRERGEVSLEAGQETTIEVVLDTGASVEGTVLDAETKRPIAGASVALHVDPHKTARTDEAGVFELQGVPFAGTWALCAGAAGFSDEVRLVDPEPDRPPPVIEFLLEPGRTLVGRVVADAGTVAGARIAAVGHRMADGVVVQDAAEAVSAEDGSFQIVGLACSARHDVLFTHQDLARVRVLVLPGAAGTTSLGDVFLPEASTVEGAVIDETTRPVEGARVTLRGGPVHRIEPEGRSGDAAGPEAVVGAAAVVLKRIDLPFELERFTTGADGGFVFPSLPAGPYEIGVECEGFVSAKRQVVVEEDLVDVQFTVQRGFAVSGRVYDDESKAAVASALVLMERVLDHSSTSAEHFERRVKTDASGAFKLSGMPVSAYRVRVSHREFLLHDGEFAVGSFSPVNGAVAWEIPLKSRRRAVSEEVDRVAAALGWDAEAAAAVETLFLDTSSDVERREGLKRILGESRSDEVESHYHQAAWSEARARVAAGMRQVLTLAGVQSGAGAETAEALISAAATDILQVWYGDGPKAVRDETARRSREERMQAVADELRKNLERPETGLSRREAHAVYDAWKRAQVFPLLR
jgi:hypothetical protein